MPEVFVQVLFVLTKELFVRFIQIQDKVRSLNQLTGTLILKIEINFSKSKLAGNQFQELVYPFPRQRFSGTNAQLLSKGWLIEVSDAPFPIPDHGHDAFVIIHDQGVPMPGHFIEVE